MDLQSRFLELKSFIREHLELIQSEVLNRYPSDLPTRYLPWIDQLKELNEKELIQIESSLDSDLASGSFRLHLKRLSELINAPAIDERIETAPPQGISRGMTQKKTHETLKIKGFLATKGYRNFLDIGSGKGHLSMALLHDQEGSSLCWDQDKSLQLAGAKKIESHFPRLKSSIHYHHNVFHGKAEIPKTFHKIDLVLGLHCCGDLSVEAMKFHLKDGADLLSFGCCYHKLSNYNLSSVAKKDPVNFSFHALNLATRSNRWLSPEDFSRRMKVKRYRYALHMILKQELGAEFEGLGNAHHTDYDLPFRQYALKSAPQTARLPLEGLFEKHISSSIMSNYLLSEAIRAPLGRAVELYLLLDRALWLQEMGSQVEVKTFFDPKISPRNIGVFSKS